MIRRAGEKANGRNGSRAKGRKGERANGGTQAAPAKSLNEFGLKLKNNGQERDYEDNQ